jgi:hypothetical protein
MRGELNQTVGMYGTSRTYARIDSGEFAGGNRLLGLRQRAAHGILPVQGGWQANAKFTMKTPLAS